MVGSPALHQFYFAQLQKPSLVSAYQSIEILRFLSHPLACLKTNPNGQSANNQIAVCGRDLAWGAPPRMSSIFVLNFARTYTRIPATCIVNQ